MVTGETTGAAVLNRHFSTTARRRLEGNPREEIRRINLDGVT